MSNLALPTVFTHLQMTDPLVALWIYEFGVRGM